MSYSDSDYTNTLLINSFTISVWVSKLLKVVLIVFITFQTSTWHSTNLTKTNAAEAILYE